MKKVTLNIQDNLYDPEVDIVRIIFSNVAIVESDEDKPGSIEFEIAV